MLCMNKKKLSMRKGKPIACFEDEDDDDVENNIDDDNDRVEDMLHEVEDEIRDRVFECLSKAAETPLYPGCTKYNKLSAVCTLYNIKTSGGWTDISFTELLVALSDMLPAGNELPRSNYYAKKLMCPFGLEYKKIHACPNDCLLYHKQYENLDKCPRCGVLHYKRKGIQALVFDKKDARNLRWHADPDRRKRDGLLRHPADSPQWKTIDKLHDTFGKEPRNLRLGLCTDGMNPFGTLSSQHITWPVLLVIYNLPPWLCMKRKYIMLSLLISGPKQPGNDIDVYLEPLFDDLRKMWDEGVSVFDAHANETFRLRAMLFCTNNDFPAYGNLSGYKNKGMKACPTCEEDTQSKYISECHKYVFLRTRRLLRRDHPYRKMKTAFDGNVEMDVARRAMTGKEVYERVKGVETVFGKSVKDKGTTGLWKKESVFWKLPYWKDLPVRHCLDVMRIEKNVCEAILGTLMNIPGKTKDTKGVGEYFKSTQAQIQPPPAMEVQSPINTTSAFNTVSPLPPPSKPETTPPPLKPETNPQPPHPKKFAPEPPDFVTVPSYSSNQHIS
ncbi:uncharacterized protein [Spinacia oleracea]|uniref:Transposase-associated domain-containing protein n=1 Tax=Spinacia oleracea TaxID=3562 RepID=A0ABM3RPU6_SPIOL|nr:uncharacterized protein LOC110790646 [Spinacia oleracea]